MPRVAFSDIVAVDSSVPPASVNCPGVATPGAVPRLPSELIASVPPLMLVAPVYVFAPASVKIPAPCLVSATTAAPAPS